ncbi:GIY-YIG nuclease family protein [Paenibacillus caseinilyticus]|uniref:LuxR family transcriptional regulator n=1 Tax=Paenibacillus mucilaginosus K02 TaxID=997761 RepID=I0BNI1_9BACL|nr:GIY-YIG nuclease family protein [Paenibacillus mucilaginosus]AFH63928.1 LuxR family transcriptional regulator [Paenibacillus mucilaginosus K02]
MKHSGRKAELLQLYKETKITGGVYQILNNVNGKRWVASTPNFRTMNGKKMELNMGGNKNAKLQADWSRYGEEAFTMEVLEVLERKETGYFDAKDALKKLEAKWLEKLQPYGEQGYNRPKEAGEHGEAGE